MDTANKFGLAFDHLGLAVGEHPAAVAFLQGIGYRIGETVFDPQQNVNLILCHHPAMPAVEIIFPATGKSRLDSLLARHPSGLVYHICYASADLAHSLQSFEADGLKAVCVSPPKPAVLFGGRPVSFYVVAGMGLIEIIDHSTART